MPSLLVVHHTPSPALHAMLDAVLAGARDDAIEGVEVTTRPALTAGAADALAADGIILGTTANIGYMSGALKHFLDLAYYPCLGETSGKAYGLYVHGNEDPTGAVRAVTSIVGALEWRQVADTVTVHGQPDGDDLAACTELGGTVAATLSLEAG